MCPPKIAPMLKLDQRVHSIREIETIKTYGRISKTLNLHENYLYFYLFT